MRHRFLAFAPTAVALLLLSAVDAVAQTPMERVDMLVGDAYADYDMLQLDPAEQKLLEAIDIAAENGVRSPGTAAAYIMLGVVWAAQTGDPQIARQPFGDGLSVDPVAEIHPYYATPTLVNILEEIRATLPPPAPEPEWEEEWVVEAPEQTWEDDPTWEAPAPPLSVAPAPPPREPGPAIVHTVITEAPAGRPLEIDVELTGEADVARVAVNFRPFGNQNYFSVDLQRAQGAFRGEIPANSVRNAVSLDYFVVAYDAAGASVGALASAAQPYTVFFLGGDGPSASRGDRAGRSGRAPDRARSGETGEIAHLALHGGTGLGLATAEPNVYADDVSLNPGLAPTPFHLAVEAGVAPGRGPLHIVPFLRMQMVFLDTGVEPLVLVGVKARYFFQDGETLRIYGQGGLGVGEVSHLVRLDQIEEGTFDTTNEGPFHVGAGIGGVVMISDHFGLQLDTYLMLLVNRVSVQLDLAAGPYIAF